MASPVPASLTIEELNHVALHVSDVERSVHFYGKVLCLPPVPRPAFDFPGAWFRLGKVQELHLIGNRGQPVHSHHRGNHFALLTSDIDSWQRYLEAAAIPFNSRRRPDGANQIFIMDPDGHTIEICTRPPAA